MDKPKQTIDEAGALLSELNPKMLFGIAREKGLIAVAVAGEWVPIVSGTITGDWVSLQGQGLPLVNGQKVYADSDFTALVNREENLR